MPNVTVPILHILWFRPKGGRWAKIGRFGTRAEALTHCRGAGDFHIAPLFDTNLASAESSLTGAAEAPAGEAR